MADVNGTDHLVRHEKDSVANGYENNGFQPCDRKAGEEDSTSDDDRLRVVVTENGLRTESDTPLPNGHTREEENCLTTSSVNGTAVVVLGEESGENGFETDQSGCQTDSAQKPLDTRLHHYIPVEDIDGKILNGSDSTHVSIPEDAVISFNTGRVRVKNRASNSPQSYRERESIPLDTIPTSYDEPGIGLQKKAEVEAELSNTKNGAWAETHIYSGSEGIYNSEKLNGTSKSSDEVSLPANSHRKCLSREGSSSSLSESKSTGEKLYFTEENRKLCPGWRRLILCGLILIIVAVAVCLAVLAATGILLAESDSKNIRHESGHSLPSVDSIAQAGFPVRRPPPNVPHKFQTSVTTEAGHFPNTTAKTEGVLDTVSPATTQVTSKVPVLNDESHSQTIVPNALVGEFTIIDENFTDDLNDNSSQGYLNLANNLETELRRIFRENRGEFEKLQILNFRPGSIRVKFVVIWIPNHQVIQAPRASEILASDLNKKNNSFFNLFHVDISSIHFNDVFDECRIQKGGCSFGCYWNYDTLQKTCICPENTYLQSDGKSCSIKEPILTTVLTSTSVKPPTSKATVIKTTEILGMSTEKPLTSQPSTHSITEEQVTTGKYPSSYDTTTAEFTEEHIYSEKIATTESSQTTSSTPVTEPTVQQGFTTTEYETTIRETTEENKMLETETTTEENRETTIKSTATPISTNSFLEISTTHPLTIREQFPVETTTSENHSTLSTSPMTEITTESEYEELTTHEEKLQDTTFETETMETEYTEQPITEYRSKDKSLSTKSTLTPTIESTIEDKATVKYHIVETPTEIYTIEPETDYPTEITKSSIPSEETFTTFPPELNEKSTSTKTTISNANKDNTMPFSGVYEMSTESDSTTAKPFENFFTDFTTEQIFTTEHITEQTTLTEQENETLPTPNVEMLETTTTPSPEINITLEQPVVIPLFNRTPGLRYYDNFTFVEPILTTTEDYVKNDSTETLHTLSNVFNESVTDTEFNDRDKTETSIEKEDVTIPFVPLNVSTVSFEKPPTTPSSLKSIDSDTTTLSASETETTPSADSVDTSVTHMQKTEQTTEAEQEGTFGTTLPAKTNLNDLPLFTTPNTIEDTQETTGSITETSEVLSQTTTVNENESTTVQTTVETSSVISDVGAETKNAADEIATSSPEVEIPTTLYLNTNTTTETSPKTTIPYQVKSESFDNHTTLKEKEEFETTTMSYTTTKGTLNNTSSFPTEEENFETTLPYSTITYEPTPTTITELESEEITTVLPFNETVNNEVTETTVLLDETTVNFLQNETEIPTADSETSETRYLTTHQPQLTSERSDNRTLIIEEDTTTLSPVFNNTSSPSSSTTKNELDHDSETETTNAFPTTELYQIGVTTEMLNRTGKFHNETRYLTDLTSTVPTDVTSIINETTEATTLIDFATVETTQMTDERATTNNELTTLSSLNNETINVEILNATETTALPSTTGITKELIDIETTTETNSEATETVTGVETTSAYTEMEVILPKTDVFSNATVFPTDTTPLIDVTTVNYNIVNATETTESATENYNTTTVADENKMNENSTSEAVHLSSTNNSEAANTFQEGNFTMTESTYDESTNETTTVAGLECRNDQFICSPLNACLNYTFMCDGILDCPDGTDEFDCEGTCHTNFMCSNSSTCIMSEARCDGIWDCDNGTDEEFCRPSECAKHEVMCSDGSKCIKPVDICDWKYDCKDRSDEVGCVERTTCESNGKFFCNDGLCIPWSLKCDGEFDCKDKEDEGNCTCLNDEFQCNDGKCLKSSSRCDGHKDCHDGDDEMGCVNVDSQHMVITFEPYSGSWALLCAEDFNLDDGHYLCQELGFGHALKINKLHVSFNGTWMAMRRENLTDYSLWTERVSFVESCTSFLAASVECQKFGCGEYTGLLHRRKRDILSSSSSSQWPFIGYTSTFRSKRGCLSEILTPIWLITSAECLLSISKQPFNASDWYVRTNIGKKTEVGNAQNHEVLRIVSHYHSSKFRSLLLRDYDVALVRLKHALVFVSDKIGAICPPEEQVPPGITCFSGVLGTEKPRAPPPSVLSINSLALQILDRKNCNTIDHYNNSINQRMLCTQSSEGHTICDNDEGTPLMCLSGINNWFLAGMLSYQRYCEVYSKHPAVFSNLYSMRKFIDQVTGQKQYEVTYDSNVYVIIPPTTPSPTVPETTTPMFSITEAPTTLEFTETTTSNYSEEYTTETATETEYTTETTLPNENTSYEAIEDANMTTFAPFMEEGRSEVNISEIDREMQDGLNYSTVSHLGYESTDILDMENFTTIPSLLTESSETVTPTTLNAGENSTVEDQLLLSNGTFSDVTITSNQFENLKLASSTVNPTFSDSKTTQISFDNETEGIGTEIINTESPLNESDTVTQPATPTELPVTEYTASFVENNSTVYSSEQMLEIRALNKSSTSQINSTTLSTYQNPTIFTTSDINAASTDFTTLQNTDYPSMMDEVTTTESSSSTLSTNEKTETFTFEMEGEPDKDLAFEITEKDGIRLVSPEHLENLRSTSEMKESLSRSRNLNEPHSISNIQYDLTTTPAIETSIPTQPTLSETETLATSTKHLEELSETTPTSETSTHNPTTKANKSTVPSISTTLSDERFSYTEADESTTIPVADLIKDELEETSTQPSTTDFTTLTELNETVPETEIITSPTSEVTTNRPDYTTLIYEPELKKIKNTPSAMNESTHPSIGYNIQTTTAQTHSITKSTLEESKFLDTTSVSTTGMKFETDTEPNLLTEEAPTLLDYVTTSENLKKTYEKQPRFEKLFSEESLSPTLEENLEFHNNMTEHNITTLPYTETENTKTDEALKLLNTTQPLTESTLDFIEETTVTTNIPTVNPIVTNVEADFSETKATTVFPEIEKLFEFENKSETNSPQTTVEMAKTTESITETETTILNEAVYSVETTTGSFLDEETATTYTLEPSYENSTLPNETTLRTIYSETTFDALLMHNKSVNGTLSDIEFEIEPDIDAEPKINNSSLLIRLSSEKLIISEANSSTDECGQWNHTIDETNMNKLKFYEEWPALGYLQMVSEQKMCAAVILSSHFVVTSFNCLKYRDPQLNPDKWAFIGGLLDSSSTSGLQTHFISEIIPHEDMDSGLLFHKHNLALVKLKDAVEMTTFSQSSCLSDDMSSQQQCFVAGWSESSSSVDHEKMFHSVPVSIIPQSECNSTMFYNGLLLDTFICASHENNSRPTCQMDLGSPLFCFRENRWFLQGILNFPGPCDIAQPAVYNSIYSVKDWIRNILD